MGIVGQIWVDGVSHSCHRFEEARHTSLAVYRALMAYAEEEALWQLGAVEVTVAPAGPLTRLRIALWSRRARGAAPAGRGTVSRRPQ